MLGVGGAWPNVERHTSPPPVPPQVLETEEEQQARLERFAAELEAGGAAGAEPAEQ